MNKQRKWTIVLMTVTIFVATAAFLPGLGRAGNLEPSAPPGSTMHTLDEIYNIVLDTNSKVGGQLEYNVAGYGAVGDGDADDTSAIQAAINDASDAGGGNVRLPAGRYKTSHSIVMKAGVALSGVGRALGFPAAVIAPTSAVQIAIHGYNQPNGFEVSHLGIDMAEMQDNSYGIYFQLVWRSLIEDVQIFNVTGNLSRGIELRTVAGSTPGTYWNRITDAWISGYNRQGRGIILRVLEGDGSETPRVTSTTLTNVTAHSLHKGFWFSETGSGIVLINCGAENNETEGLLVGDVTGSQGGFVKVIGGEFTNNDTFDIVAHGEVVLFGTVANKFPAQIGKNISRVLYSPIP